MDELYTMADSRVDIKRDRGHSDTSSYATSSSSGSHGRRRFPEKLVDRTRRVAGLGVSFVDNGATVTAGLANVVSKKACMLEMKLRNPVTGEHTVCCGQAGLIQAERLTASPQPAENPPKRAALIGTAAANPTVEVPTPPSSLRSSRFATIPITCIHNLEDDVVDGVTWEFDRSELTPVGADTSRMFVIDFQNARYRAEPSESIVIRAKNDDEAEINWSYHDVTTAEKINNVASPLTLKSLNFPMASDGYEFQSGQKIGIAVYRSFEIEANDAGLTQNSITTEELRQIFGSEGRVNIYTGQITNVSPGKEAFEHSINTFQGCSGAVIFLLDQNQQGHGVSESDYGKAIAVHVGGQELSNGTIVNFGFKIILG